MDLVEATLTELNQFLLLHNTLTPYKIGFTEVFLVSILARGELQIS